MSLSRKVSSYHSRVNRAKYFLNSEVVNLLCEAHGAEKVIDATVGDGSVIIEILRNQEFGFIKAFPEREYQQVSFEAKLTQYLYEKEIPVPKLLQSINGDTVVSITWMSISIPSFLLKKIPGVFINKINKCYSISLADILKDFHFATACYQEFKHPLLWGTSPPHKVLNYWKENLKGKEPCHQLMEVWLDSWEENKNNLDTNQKIIIHGDLYAKNILIDDFGRIGIIDLSDLRLGFPEEDLGSIIYLHGSILGANSYNFAMQNFLSEYDRLEKQKENNFSNVFLVLLFAAYYAIRNAINSPNYSVEYYTNLTLARSYIEEALNFIIEK